MTLMTRKSLIGIDESLQINFLLSYWLLVFCDHLYRGFSFLFILYSSLRIFGIPSLYHPLSVYSFYFPCWNEGRKCAFLPHNLRFLPLSFLPSEGVKSALEDTFPALLLTFLLLLAAKFLPTPFCLCCPKILDFQMGRFPKALNINKIQ